MASNTEKRITAKMILDSSGYNNSLRGVNAETQKYQAQMKVASEGIKAFGKDSEKLKSVQESLSKQIEQHSKKVDIYKQSLEKTTSKMQDNVKERDRLKESLTKTESELKKFIDSSSKEVQTYAKNREELTKLNKQYDESKKKYGENSKEAEKLKEQITKLENEQKKLIDSNEKECKTYEKTKGEVEKLENEYKKKEKAVESNAKQVQSYETNLNKANAQMTKTQGELKKVTEELDKQNNKWVQAGEKLEKHSKSIKDTGKGITEFGKDVSKLSLPIAAVGIAAGKSAIDFESAFTGVKKTVEGTDEQFAQLSKGIRNMSKEMPQSAVEIAGVAEAAGQLGIKTENIEGFTKSMVMLGDSTNMSSEQAATSLARLANITQMPQTEFDKLGSVIVHLGNNLATTESEIVEMGLRLAGAGKQIGLTEGQTLGLAGAFSSVGIEAEMGGSAISKVMVKMQAAATIGSEQAKKLSQATGMSMRELELLASNNGKAFKEVASSLNMTTAEMNSIIKSSKELDNFGKIAGMTGEQFKQAFQKDASTALIAFIRGLGNAENAGTSAIEMLEEMGIKEVRLRDSLLRAANAGTLLEDSVNMGTKAWGENVALVNEASQRYETTESKLKMAKNQIVDAGITIGNNLLPVVRDAAVKVADLTKRFSELSPETQQTIMKVAGFAAVTGPAIVGIGKLTTGIGSILGLAGKISGGIGKFRLAMKGAEVAATGIGTATGAASTGMGAMGLLAKAGPLLLNPYALAIGAVGIGAVALGKHLSQDAVPKVDLFAKKVETTTKTIKTSNGNIIQTHGQMTKTISEGTKKAVGEYIKLDDGARKSLMNLYTNGKKISVDTKNELVKNYDDMGGKIKSGIDKHSKEDLKIMKDFLKNSKDITKEEQDKILQDLQENNTKKQTEINGYTKRITEILTKASADNREVTKEEQEEINGLQDKMRENAVKSLSDSEVESKLIMERLKEYSGRITLEQAGEVIKNAETQRKKSVSEAESQYDNTVRNIIRMRDETGTISAEQATKMIEEAERQKKESVDKAEDMKKQIVEKVKEQGGDIIHQLDTNNGNIQKNWSGLTNWFNKNPIVRWIKTKVDEASANSRETIGRTYTGTNYWKGGLTYLHDQPGTNNNYELYDLPRGTRVFNHDASQDLVMKTAEDVASKVANGVLSKFNNIDGNSNSEPILIQIPVIIEGREIARASAKYMNQELAYNNRGW